MPVAAAEVQPHPEFRIFGSRTDESNVTDVTFGIQFDKFDANDVVFDMQDTIFDIKDARLNIESLILGIQFAVLGNRDVEFVVGEAPRNLACVRP